MTDAPHSPADHYSYSVYADPAMAEAFDALRFSGPIGRLIAETQERVVASFLAPVAGRTVLDVGTGTGRAAIALAARGARVTGVDASGEMLAVAERRAKDAGVRVTFTPGDAHGLAFADRSFDAVICLRVLMHTPDWRRSLGELCRIARDRVVFDYPALVSAAALQAAARHAAARRSADALKRTGSSPIARLPRRSRGTASGSPTAIGSSCCRSPSTNGSIRRRRPPVSKARSRAPASRGCLDRP